MTLLRPGTVLMAAAMAVAFPATAYAQTEDYVAPADELAEARAIMTAMFPEDQREQMILGMAVAMGQQAAAGVMTGPVFEEPGIKAIIEAYLAELPQTLRPLFAKHLPSIFEATAIAYTRKFSLDELRDIGAFAKTSSGQRYFANLQTLLSDPAVAAANQAMFNDVGPIQSEQSARIVQQVEAYLIANPDVIERLEKAGMGEAK
jgi:hypothetical protein